MHGVALRRRRSRLSRADKTAALVSRAARGASKQKRRAKGERLGREGAPLSAGRAVKMENERYEPGRLHGWPATRTTPSSGRVASVSARVFLPSDRAIRRSFDARNGNGRASHVRPGASVRPAPDYLAPIASLFVRSPATVKAPDFSSPSSRRGGGGKTPAPISEKLGAASPERAIHPVACQR